MPSSSEPGTGPRPEPEPTNEEPGWTAATAGDPSSLQAELDSLRVALRIERVRTSELLRAAEESRAASRDSRSRGPGTNPDAERYRADARALAATLTSREAALAHASASVAALDRTNRELKQELELMRRRVPELEAGHAAGRAGRDAIAHAARLAREVAAAGARADLYFERLQTGEWRRGVWETRFRELETRARTPAPTAAVRVLAAAAGDEAADARIRDLEAALSAVRSSAVTEVRALRHELAAVAAERDAALADGRRLEHELAAERPRLEALVTAQRAQTLERERVRGALAERELHMRRLERSLAQAAQAAERPAAAAPQPAPVAEPPADGTLPHLPAVEAALIPLDGEGADAHQIGNRLRVGRAPDNDLCLDVSSVSRHHALVVWVAGGAIIEDLQSANGVWVNGRRIRQARLADGDIVALGILRFRYTAQTLAAADPVQAAS